jgi:toxin ParE1/3/4
VVAKPVTFGNLARVDLDSAAAYYVANAGVDVAERFIDAVEVATRRIGKNPGLGALRFAYELSIPGLRSTSVAKFPYLMFYSERDEVVEVWRVLHTRRDIPATLQDEPTS